MNNHSGGGGINLSYIITPFLDMAFQLLAFFIMTYHPSALEGHVDGKLVPMPGAIAGPKVPVPLEELPVADPDLTETLIVQIKAVAAGNREGDRHDGEPSQILLKLLQETKVISDSADGSLDVGLKKLENELRAQRQQAGAMKTGIKIASDGNLKHLYLMRVFDVCKSAGYRDISFVAPPAARTNKN